MFCHQCCWVNNVHTEILIFGEMLLDQLTFSNNESDYSGSRKKFKHVASHYGTITGYSFDTMLQTITQEFLWLLIIKQFSAMTFFLDPERHRRAVQFILNQ